MYVRLNGLIEEALQNYADIELVEFLMQKLHLPEFKAKALADRIDAQYGKNCAARKLEKTNQNSEDIEKGISEQNSPYVIDSLSVKEFERFLKWLFNELGYEVHPGKYVVEMGVDLVVSKDGEKVAIQAKLYPKGRNISNQAITKAYQAMGGYGCKKSIIITSGYFTAQAISDAAKLNLELWDQKTIAAKIEEAKMAIDLDLQEYFPKYKESLLQSLINLEQTGAFILERKANGKHDLRLPGVKYPVLSFQVRYNEVIRCVYRIKNNQPVGESDGTALIRSDRNQRYGPDGERAYALIIKYLEQFIE